MAVGEHRSDARHGQGASGEIRVVVAGEDGGPKALHRDLAGCSGVAGQADRVGFDELASSLLTLIEVPRVDVLQQGDGPAIGPRLERRLGRCEGATGGATGIRREGGGTVEQFCPGREPTPVLRPLGGPLQFRRDHLVRAGGGIGQVADMAILVDVRSDHLGENVVHRSPIDGGRGAVDRRPHQRMPEHDSTSQRHHTSAFGWFGGIGREVQPGCGRGDRNEVARGLGRREQQPPPRRLRQPLDHGDVVILHAPTDRQGLGQRLAPIELSNRQRGTQVTQRERVAGRGLKHPVGHPSVDRPAHHHSKQLEPVLVPKGLHVDRRQPVER